MKALPVWMNPIHVGRGAMFLHAAGTGKFYSMTGMQDSAHMYSSIFSRGPGPLPLMPPDFNGSVIDMLGLVYKLWTGVRDPSSSFFVYASTLVPLASIVFVLRRLFQ